MLHGIQEFQISRRVLVWPFERHGNPQPAAGHWKLKLFLKLKQSSERWGEGGLEEL